MKDNSKSFVFSNNISNLISSMQNNIQNVFQNNLSNISNYNLSNQLPINLPNLNYGSLNTSLYPKVLPNPFTSPIKNLNYFLPWKRASLDPSLVKPGTEVHLSPLPETVTPDELFKTFSFSGEIIDIRIIPRKEKRHCFAFIRFLNSQSVDNLLKINCAVNSMPVKISRSKEETTIFVGNINKYWKRSFIEKAIKDRINHYDEFRFFEDPHNPKKNRGYCFIKINNPIKAKEAFENLSKNILIDDCVITVDWAEDFSDRDVNKVQIHLSGLDERIKTEDLFFIFSNYGQIINIKLAKDIEGKGRKDYGFITYSNENEAAKAMKEFKWENHFKKPIYLQYARKIGSIIKHKQKLQTDLLEKKRNRDSSSKDKKSYKAKNYSEDEDEDSLIDDYIKRKKNETPNKVATTYEEEFSEDDDKSNTIEDENNLTNLLEKINKDEKFKQIVSNIINIISKDEENTLEENNN